MLSQLNLSAIDRLIPRIATAVLMLAFARASNPTVVGYYAAVMTGYVLLQSVTDGAAKRIAVSAVKSQAGRVFLTRYLWAYGIGGTFFILATVGLVALWGAPLADLATFAPLVFVPIVMGRTITPLAILQLQNKWAQIAKASAIASLAALAVSLPLTLALHNALGSTSQLLITEAIFAVLVLRSAALVDINNQRELETKSYLSEFIKAGLYILGIQGQYQLDKLFIGLAAGPPGLGNYNLAWSLSRGFSDSFATGTLNVVQARLNRGTKDEVSNLNLVAKPAMQHSMVVSSGFVLAAYIISRLFGIPLLGQSWTTALGMVPLLALSAIPTAASYILWPIAVMGRGSKAALSSRILGMSLSLVVGITAFFSLTTAAWIIVLRELLTLAVIAVSARSLLRTAMLLTPFLTTLGMGILIEFMNLLFTAVGK